MEPQPESSLLSKLALEEKLALLTGDGLWTVTANFPRLDLNSSFRLSDGPHGVRKPLSDLTLQEAFPATCFPAGCALACSWSTDVLFKVGQALSVECEYFDIQVLLGPAMNLKRHPGGGRNLEYFSEDPILTGRLAAAYVKGVQESGSTSACVKHFAVNNQESHRMVVNVVVDERTLREIYLTSFEIAIRESKPKFVMGAYNRLNGRYCCNHQQLLQTLRDEWEFEGICVTDWGATNDRVESIKAGLDLEMPTTGKLHYSKIKKALLDGRLSHLEIDRCAQRILDFLLRVKEQKPKATSNDDPFEDNHQVAHDIAMECAVLLQNKRNLLPLAKNTSIALIGDFAKDNPRYQGMGSSHVSPTKVTNAYDAIKSHTDSVVFAQGYNADQEDDLVDEDLIREAVKLTSQAQAVVLFLGLPMILESEGFDRFNLQMPKQHVALLEAVCQAHDKIVVVLHNGGVIELPKSLLQVSAIVEGYLLGQAGAVAIVDLLFGVASPCGKLPETLAISVKDVPSESYFPGTRDRVEYREGLDVGYRHFNTARGPLYFPFGHGLSYTTFEYRHLSVSIAKDEDRNKQVKISFELSNTGATFEAKEIVQYYIHQLSPTVYRPYHELKDFSKVSLRPGEVETVCFELSSRAFAFYDIGHSSWIVEPGTYEIQIGASSQDIRLRKQITFTTGIESSQVARESYPPKERVPNTDTVSNETFARRFGHHQESILEIIQTQVTNDRQPIHQNSLLKEVAKRSIIGKILLWIIFKVACKEVKAGPSKRREVRMLRENVENLPLRTFILFSKGVLSFNFLKWLIIILNGQFLFALFQEVRNGLRNFTIWMKNKLSRRG